MYIRYNNGFNADAATRGVTSFGGSFSVRGSAG